MATRTNQTLTNTRSTYMPEGIEMNLTLSLSNLMGRLNFKLSSGELEKEVL